VGIVSIVIPSLELLCHIAPICSPTPGVAD